MQRVTVSVMSAFSSSLYLAAPLVLLACGADASGEADVVSEAHALAGGGHCAAGLLQNPETQQCAPIADRRAEAQRAAARRPERLPPNLKALRGTADGAPPRAEARAARSRVSIPDHVPGGLGAGVSYKSGALPVTESSTLYTHMIVYPEGLGFDVPADLFTTATNRTEKTVEVVGWYREASVHHIGIFDWSCSATDPCAGGQTVPSWIWTRPFSDNTCQLTQMADGAGVNHETLYYANATVSTASGWENRVLFWNYCTSQWDLEYVHAFTGPQQDCSVTGCGWWGPIVENFSPLEDQPFPQLGFIDTSLVHDGVTSLLPPSETDFNGPPSTWHLCFIDPNTSWSTSQIPCGASTTPWTATLTLTSNWNTGYCADVAVHNGGTTAISTWSVSLAMNQSTLTSSHSGSFQATSAGQYQITPLSWNANLAPGATTSFGFCANKTGTNYTPTVTTP
ncbi:cellulose binding domain-containing protein [Sorangium sp. So ce176]|uniref:cellulose binding domain-containing protein n=1 Tax=Sorangium sp. So ce176 TaxID=3133286 RepID=UPI003F62509C